MAFPESGIDAQGVEATGNSPKPGFSRGWQHLKESRESQGSNKVDQPAGFAHTSAKGGYSELLERLLEGEGSISSQKVCIK